MTLKPSPDPRPGPSRTALGRRGEDLAAQLLLREGYRLIDRNYRIRQGEIDLIAEDGEILCFVEVRSKKDVTRGHPLETIDRRKRGRILRAAEHYLATRRTDCDEHVRFDVISIVYEPDLEILLIQDAFDTGSDR